MENSLSYITSFLEKAGAFIDASGSLQLEHGLPIADDASPHGAELCALADAIADAFGESGLADDELGHTIHQLRYYIDEHNIAYVRRVYGGEGVSDAKALRRYARAEFKPQRMLHVDSQYHNRSPRSFKRPRRLLMRVGNYKRLTPNYHGEFIISRRGHFVTQWDWLERDEAGHVIWQLEHYEQKYAASPKTLNRALQAFADTESFNYASHGGALHARLDIDPADFDPPLRLAAKHRWPSFDF